MSSVAECTAEGHVIVIVEQEAHQASVVSRVQLDVPPVLWIWVVDGQIKPGKGF